MSLCAAAVSSASVRIAVLVNDFRAINIDAELIEAHEADTIRLSNGADIFASYTFRSDRPFRPQALRELSRRCRRVLRGKGFVLMEDDPGRESWLYGLSPTGAIVLRHRA